METREITIRVSAKAARAYEEATADRQRKLEVLLSLKLTEATRLRQPLEEILDEVSREARERGLREEILNSILHES
jgi:hypothetical protein